MNTLDSIAKAVSEFFGFFKEREENVSVRHLQRTIKRQARAIDSAEKYIQADLLLEDEDDPKTRKKLLSVKSTQHDRFFKYN